MIKSELERTVPQDCAGCGKLILDRYLLKALEVFWHEDCLKCGCCDCRLGEVGSTLFTKGNLILCRRDYLRLFGTTGYCSACSKVIPAFEMVMRARNNVYHLECFACQQCNHRFCVGDKFYLCDNKILCEYDYEERLVFASMACSPTSLAHLKRQIGGLDSTNVDNSRKLTQQMSFQQQAIPQQPSSTPQQMNHHSIQSQSQSLQPSQQASTPHQSQHQQAPPQPQVQQHSQQPQQQQQQQSMVASQPLQTSAGTTVQPHPQRSLVT